MDNYEEKYKAALGWMKGLYSGLHGATKEEAEKYFPELKDSEEERIKREILELVSISGNGNQYEEIKDWLEKQGHMLDPDKVVAWLECKAFQSWADPIDTRPIIRKFKKDFGL